MTQALNNFDPLQLNNLYYFSAHTRSDDDVKRTFLVRKEVLQELIDGISSEEAGSIPQHYMIIGSRGMGKSTLLKRLEIEMRTGAMKEHFIPILFPEEQYNIDRLSKFWLNSLDALADTFEEEKNEEETTSLDQVIRALTALQDEDDLSDQAFDLLKARCANYKRRPVFLIDNIDILFESISEDQQFKLRKNITQNGAPIFVGASTRNPDDSLNYDAAFYDAFDNIYLDNLSNSEMREMLVQLATQTGKENTVKEIYGKAAQLEALHSLTGGNPRMAIFMFQLIANGLSDKIFENLNVLLDLITPLYKSNFEQLSKQAQVIVDALALAWDPCDLDMLSHATKLEPRQLSAPLDRLIKSGWVERGARFSEEKKAVMARNKNYSIRERFFNIWYIMRRASRRQRGALKSLTCFLETFYTREHLALEKMRMLGIIKTDPDSGKVTYALALAHAHERDGDGSEMENEIYRALIANADGDKQKIAQYLDPDDIPQDLYDEYVIKNKDWFEYASNLLDTKEYRKAETLLQAVIEKDRKNNMNLGVEYAWSMLGLVYEGMGKYAEAESVYKKSTELNQESSSIWGAYAIFLTNRDNNLEAENVFKKAIELDGANSKYWSWLGLVLYKLSKYPEAEDAYKRSIELDATNASAWGLLGMMLHDKSNRYAEAEKAYEKAIELTPNRYVLWNFYGKLLLYDLGKYNEAKKALETSIRLNPAYPPAIFDLTSLLRDKVNDFVKAEKLFYDNESLLKASNTNYHLHKALFAEHKKNWGIAKDSWLTVISLTNQILLKNEWDEKCTWTDWYRAISTTQKLGYGNELLQLFSDKDVHSEFRPMYEALKALEMGDKNYLLNVAEEVSNPAGEIYDFMKSYQE